MSTNREELADFRTNADNLRKLLKQFLPSNNSKLCLLEPDDDSDIKVIQDTMDPAFVMETFDALIRQAIALNKKAPRKKDHVVMDPSSFKGVYGPVQVSKGMKTFISQIGKLPSDPKDSKSEPISKFIPNAKEGYMLRNLLTKILNLYFLLNNEDNAIAVTEDMEKAFGSQKDAFFFIDKDGNKVPTKDRKDACSTFDSIERKSNLKIKEMEDDLKVLEQNLADLEEKGALKPQIDKLQKEIASLTKNLEKQKNRGRIERIDNQSIASLNYKTEKLLSEEGDNATIARFKDGKFKQSLEEEHNKIVEICNAYAAEHKA